MHFKELCLHRHQLTLRAIRLADPALVEKSLIKLLRKRRVLTQESSVLLTCSRFDPALGKGWFDFGFCAWGTGSGRLRKGVEALRSALSDKPICSVLAQGTQVCFTGAEVLAEREVESPCPGAMIFTRFEIDLEQCAFTAADNGGRLSVDFDWLALERSARIGAICGITWEFGGIPEASFRFSGEIPQLPGVRFRREDATLLIARGTNQI